MVSTGVAQREVRSLCKEMLKTCQQLPEGPTTTHVRATSSKLTGIIGRIGDLYAPAGGRRGTVGRLTKVHLLVVENGLVSQILTFLLWSLPLLPSEVSKEPEGATYDAWCAAGDILTALASCGRDLAEDEPGAGSALLQQLQPAYNISKPGK